MRFLRRLSPLAPWKLLRTLDEVRELPALRTKVQAGLKETKRLQKQIRDERKELAVLSTRVQQFEAVYKSDTRAARSPDRALKRIGDVRATMKQPFFGGGRVVFAGAAPRQAGLSVDIDDRSTLTRMPAGAVERLDPTGMRPERVVESFSALSDVGRHP